MAASHSALIPMIINLIIQQVYEAENITRCSLTRSKHCGTFSD